MMTFFTEDAHHAVIEYYSNEKKNAGRPEPDGCGRRQRWPRRSTRCSPKR